MNIIEGQTVRGTFKEVCEGEEPDWDALPDVLPGPLAARVLGIKRRSLKECVRLGQLPRPETGPNWTRHKKADVRAFWEERRHRVAQGYITLPVRRLPPPEEPELPEHWRRPAEAPNAITVLPAPPSPLTPEAQAALLGQAFGDSLRVATEPLLQQIAALTGQVAQLNARIGELSEDLLAAQEQGYRPARMARRDSGGPRRR